MIGSRVDPDQTPRSVASDLGLLCLRRTICDKKSKRKFQGVPQSQLAALPRHQEEEEIDKIKQAQIEQMHEKH